MTTVRELIDGLEDIADYGYSCFAPQIDNHDTYISDWVEFVGVEDDGTVVFRLTEASGYISGLISALEGVVNLTTQDGVVQVILHDNLPVKLIDESDSPIDLLSYVYAVGAYKRLQNEKEEIESEKDDLERKVDELQEQIEELEEEIQKWNDWYQEGAENER